MNAKNVLNILHHRFVMKLCVFELLYFCSPNTEKRLNRIALTIFFSICKVEVLAQSFHISGCDLWTNFRFYVFYICGIRTMFETEWKQWTLFRLNIENIPVRFIIKSIFKFRISHTKNENRMLMKCEWETRT